MLEKTLDLIFKVVKSVCKIMLCIQVISVTIVFVGRYFFNVTPPWGEELTLFCLVWLSLLGAAIPMRTGGHLRMTLLDHFLPPKALDKVDVLGDLLIVGFSVVILIAGIAMTIQVSSTILHGIKISKGFLYAAVPTSATLFLLAQLDKYYRVAKKTLKKEDVDHDAGNSGSLATDR